MTIPLDRVTDASCGLGRCPPTRWALASLSLSMLMPSLDTSIANVGLPTLVEAFGASFQEIQWVVLAYLLATTTLVVGAGRLGDLVGRRRLLLVGIGVFTAASLGCGLAPTLPVLVVARGVQGIGAAVMLPLTIALVGETVPAGRIGSAMGLLGTMSAIGTTLGPSLGGMLITLSGWRMIFLVNVPLGLVNLLLAVWSLPADRSARRADHASFDGAGTLLLAAALGAYALAVTTGHGTFGPVNGALLLAAAAALGLFVVVEARVGSPLLRLEAFRDLTLTTGLVTTAVVSTVMMATLVVGPFYLSGGLGLDAGRVGLVMSLGPAVAALTGVPAGRIVDRLGGARMTTLGLVGMAAGLLALSVAPARFGVGGYLVAIAVVTAHYALFQAANTTIVMASAGPERRGSVSGMLGLSRNLGLVTGAAVMGAIFAFASGAPELVTAPTAALAGGLRVTFALSAGLVLAAVALSVRRTTSSARPGTALLR